MKMKNRVYIAMMLAAASLGAAASQPQEPFPDPDTRSVLRLPPDERHLVLMEMRSFVTAIQQIVDGVSSGEMDRVSEAARKMGSGAANQIPPEVVAKLPETFKRYAGKVHTTFDRIALDARDFGDEQHTMRQVSELMKTCIACHATYQVEKQKYPEP